MGNLRLLALLAGAALLLSGCAAPEPSQPPPLLSWDDRVLSGLPWPEELALSLPDEELCEGLPLPELEPPLLVLWDSLGEASVQYRLKGTVPTVMGTVYDLPGVQMVPLARLQVFLREEFDQPDRYLKAGDRILPCWEAGDRVVFSDDRYVVLDMTDLAGDPPLDQLLEEAESPRSGDLGYLRIACDYCREHLGRHISTVG